ncbi:MAG: hypothetical protein ACPGZP_08240, partial [Panacagrimonas sp.]
EYFDVTTAALLLDISYETAWETCQGMVSDNLLHRVNGHLVAGKLYMLTAKGAALARVHLGQFDAELRPRIALDRAGTHYAAHNLLAQRYSALWQQSAGEGAYVLSPNQIRTYGLALGYHSEKKAAWKIPDAILIRPYTAEEIEDHFVDAEQIALEVQQSREARETRGYKLWQLKTAIEEGQVTHFRYVSTNSKILASYESHWKDGLFPYKFDKEKHRWRKVKKAKPVKLLAGFADYGQFELVDQSLAKGLFPEERESAAERRARVEFQLHLIETFGPLPPPDFNDDWDADEFHSRNCGEDDYLLYDDLNLYGDDDDYDLDAPEYDDCSDDDAEE